VLCSERNWERNWRNSTAIHALNTAASGTAAEAGLVDALREQLHPVVSLVAAEKKPDYDDPVRAGFKT